MIEVSVSEVKTNFSKYLNQAVYGQERVVITSRGKPKAVIIGIKELERLEAIEETGPPLADDRIPNQRAIDLLQAWADEPDDVDETWWDEFEKDLQENRLTFREIEFNER